MSRRGNGEGAVYFNAERDRWEGQLDLGTEPGGKRRRRKVTGPTKTAVTSRLTEIRKHELHVRPACGVSTVKDLLDSWLDVAAPSRVSLRTLNKYECHAKHVRDDIGTIRLDRLGPEDVDRYLLRKAREGYSRSTVVQHRSVLGQAVRWGIRRRYLAWDVVAAAEMPSPSVFEAAEPIVKNRRSPKAMNADQLRRFVVAARKRRHGVALIVGATLGLRPGEFSALSWPDIDLESGVLEVRQAWAGEGKHRCLGPPKTRGSIRAVSIPTEVVADLRRQREWQRRERSESKTWDPNDPGLVFTTGNGRPIDPSNLRRLTREVAAEAGVGHLTPYDLRHSATTVLSNAGVPNEQLADLLGHVDTRMVERHYRHRLGGAVRVAVDPMDEILAPDDQRPESTQSDAPEPNEA